jgi:integrase
MADYIIKRGKTYYFKRAVPTRLAPIIGKKVWKETLKAYSEQDAKQAVLPLLAITNEEIRRAKAEHHRTRASLAFLTSDEKAILEEAGGFKGLREAAKGIGTDLRFARVATDLLASVATGPRRDITKDGIDPDALEQELREAEAYAQTLRAQLERDRSILARERLRRSDAIPEDELPQDPEAPAPDIDLGTLVNVWIRQEHLNDQHAGQYRYPVKLFEEWHGPVPLRSITKAHIRDWRNAVTRLPRSTKVAYRSARMREAIGMADKDAAVRITPQTAAKHLSALRTLLQFAASEGYLESNPASDLKPPKSKKGKKSEESDRKAFTLDQRRRLFASLAKTYTATEDNFWVPLVAIYQGMRAEEICQLAKADIRQVAGRWVIDVTDKGDDQKIKNSNSVRTIPLAHQLIEKGFLDHVARSPGPRVFQTLPADKRGRFAGPYGKRFGRHLRKHAGITDPELVFHSLRGTWKDAARNAGVPGDVQERIMGHKERGNPTAAGYGDGHNLDVIAEWMKRVDPFKA